MDTANVVERILAVPWAQSRLDPLVHMRRLSYDEMRSGKTPSLWSAVTITRFMHAVGMFMSMTLKVRIQIWHFLLFSGENTDMI